MAIFNKHNLFVPILLGIVLLAGAAVWWQKKDASEQVFCTQDAKMCPDGSYVGRQGPKCEFAACPSPQATVTPLADDMVILDQPLPGGVIRSPLKVTGKARGTWFFEASFPVTLTDWDGRIIAQVPAQAQGEWMTTDFVPFEATLTFTNPGAVVSSRGFLILQKDNPSGLPQFDDHREITVFFGLGK